jgi:hypothetical protein
MRAPPTPAQQAQASARRVMFIDALGDYIDARINYGGADPEWRSTREIAQAADALDTALAAILGEDTDATW